MYVEEPVVNVPAPVEEEKDRETGRLAHVNFTNWYGHMLPDSQRVARFNDFRAFQLFLESNFSSEVGEQLERFLEEEKRTRTKQEAMEYYEKRMDTIDLDFVYT